MKLTKSKLKQIIKEELANEGMFDKAKDAMGFGDDPGIPHPIDDLINKLQQKWDTKKTSADEEWVAQFEKALTDAAMFDTSTPEPGASHLRRIKQ